jgi:dolichol-phosphate mannosyltransferase
MNVLVVIPTYNEEPNIARMLSAVRSVVPEVSILVVDDGSPDRTDELVEQAAQQLGQISLLRREAKGGLGSAYRAGFAWGIERGFDTFVEIDADFSHDPTALPKLLKKAGEGADVVIGSRYVRGGTIPDWPWYRHLLSWSGNKYASLMLRLGVADATAGYRVYRSDILTRMLAGPLFTPKHSHSPRKLSRSA